MQYTTRLLAFIVLVTASALATVMPRNEDASLSVILYDDVDYVGASFSPANQVQRTCIAVSGDWEDRAESATISTGYTCLFFGEENCPPGAGVSFSASIPNFLTVRGEKETGDLYNNIESFCCLKNVDGVLTSCS